MCRRRTVVGLLAASAALCLLAGCAAEPQQQGRTPSMPVAATVAAPDPVPSPSPPRTAAEVPDIPVRSSRPRAVERPAPPVRLRIAGGEADVDVRVRPVGIERGGRMELPARVDVAGWYRYGPAPGSDAGSVVIAAHVDSLRYGVGPFARLRDLDEGAEIRVRDDDDRTHRYRVNRVRSVPKAAIPLSRIFTRTGDPRLVLITCGGTFDHASRTYSDNVLVFATPIER